MSEELIRLVNISKEYDGEVILDQLNLYILKNEFLTLLGPSGCGKTTTLRLIGGFESPTSGDILFNGEPMQDLPPFKRKVNTVFQRYALFPHMNVFDNVAFGLKIKKLDKKTIQTKVNEMLELVDLPGYGKRAVDSLSGGQQQRVAIARALVNEPEVLLLDEPLSALDLKMRKEMQLELKKIQQRLGITFVFVTHDQEEALTMSDTIMVMKDGKIQQIGTPIDIYNEPKNAFVADFIGESNIIEGVMHADYQVEFLRKSVACVDKGFDKDEPVDVVIRPEDIKFAPAGAGLFSGFVESVVFKGVHYESIIAGEDYRWMVHSTTMEPVGSLVGLDIGPNDIHIMRKVRH